MSGEFDSQSTGIEGRLQIFIELSFRELCHSKLCGFYAFDNMVVIH